MEFLRSKSLAESLWCEKGCPELIRKLKDTGIREEFMTTNGVLLEDYLDDLCHAGLDAVNQPGYTLPGSL